jgi:hypothetical protein
LNCFKINDILRSPARARRNITAWNAGDSPRLRWIQKMGLLDQDSFVNEEEKDDHENDWSDVDSTYSIGSSIVPEGEQR